MADTLLWGSGFRTKVNILVWAEAGAPTVAASPGANRLPVPLRSESRRAVSLRLGQQRQARRGQLFSEENS